MARSEELLKMRNEALERRYNEIQAANKRYSHSTILELLESEFFIDTDTITDILSGRWERRRNEKKLGEQPDPNQLSIFNEIEPNH